MYATKSGILKSFDKSSFPPWAGLFLFIILAAALFAAAGPAQAAEVSLIVTENNGPVSVTANATFSDGVLGYVKIYVDDSHITNSSGIGSASCSIILDGAIYSNGVHTVSAEAWDPSNTVEATDTFTIQNPVSLSAGTQAKPTEALDVTGNAQFLARTADGNKTGRITISTKLSTLPDTSYNSWHGDFFTPNVTFSCEDVVGMLFDVAYWTNGNYDIKVDAMAENDGTIAPVYLTTEIMNPIDLTSQVDPKPTGPMNVTGSATFIATRAAGRHTGTIIISLKLSTLPDSSYFYFGIFLVDNWL